jgi:hypothetical protein
MNLNNSLPKITFILCIFITASCKHYTIPDNLENKKTIEKAKLLKTNCNCANSIDNCPDCVKEFMDNQTFKSYTIDWSSCIDPNGICNSSPNSSTIDFCIEEIPGGNPCGMLCATIHNPPSCLPCLYDGMKLETPIDCASNGQWYIHFIDASGITIDVSGDPKFIVTCWNNITNQNYNCVGDMQ